LSPVGTRRVSVLLGFLPELQARGLLLTDNLVDAPRDFGEITRLWTQAVRARKGLRQIPMATTSIEALLPADFASYEQQLFSTETFQRFYQGSGQFRLKLVPVKRLITPQYYLNRDRVDAMVAAAPEPGDLAGALEFAFGLGDAIPDPVSDGGAILFRTTTTRLCQAQPPDWRRVGLHEIEVVQRIQTRPNLFQVARISAPRVDDRLIVTNGIHRAAALHCKGWNTSRLCCETRIIWSKLDSCRAPQAWEAPSPSRN
jgi:hypothetical protein